jgi:hypothetical protein
MFTVHRFPTASEFIDSSAETTDKNLAACGGTFLTGLTRLTKFSLYPEHPVYPV